MRPAKEPPTRSASTARVIAPGSRRRVMRRSVRLLPHEVGEDRGGGVAASSVHTGDTAPSPVYRSAGGWVGASPQPCSRRGGGDVSADAASHQSLMASSHSSIHCLRPLATSSGGRSSDLAGLTRVSKAGGKGALVAATGYIQLPVGMVSWKPGEIMKARKRLARSVSGDPAMRPATSTCMYWPSANGAAAYLSVFSAMMW